MKNLFLICFALAIYCSPLQSHAQLLGKWAIPTGTGNSPIEVSEVLVMEFLENDLIQHTTIAIPGGLITAPDQIGDGAFDSDYNHEFSVVSDYLFYANQNVDWISNPYPEFLPECQMVSRPDNTGRYYFFYSIEEPGKNVDNHLFYNEMWRENNSVQVGPQNGAIYNTDAGSLIAFAITEKNYFINDDHWAKFIYISSGGFNSNPQYNAGLRKYEITENGFDFSSMEEIVTETHQDFTEDDFSAYNLELKIDENENTAVAWISQKTNICQQVYVAVNKNTFYKHILNKGRIGGIEFSTLDPNILYVSCPDSGIVALNYSSGEHFVLPNSQDFGHTFLQTAPDGHIYALNDGGYILGRISMQDGSFDPDCFTIPNSYMVSTFRVFDNTNYYILPENQRTYNPLIVTVDTVPESCPGYADGSAIICVSGGNPAAPPDPGYNITCTGPGGNSIDYDYFDPATGCFHFENLTAGFYTFSITDDIGTFYEGSFTIGDTYYDTDIIVIDYDLAWTDHYADQYRIEYLLLIKDNAVLDIDNTILEFGPDGKVIIEPGSRINADYSLFRNLNCEPYKKWKGIEVWGDASTHQYDSSGVCAQGYLYLNNSTVMHAENGVALWAEEDRIWSTAGGIVKATQSDFIDNTRAVHFVPYENYYPYEPYEACNNLSSFKLCDFTLDQDYIDESTFYKHVDLHGVNGIGFYGCNFTLTATSGVSQWNNGIASYGSGFKVDEGCMPPCFSYEPSTFEGFYRAVSAHGNNTNDYTYEVWNSEFTNNTIGIYNIEVGNAVMVDNDFYVGYNGTDDNADCSNVAGSGIEIFHANGYAIENNYFTKLQGAPADHYVGVRLNETKSEADDVYNNELTGLSVGNLAEGDNRSSWDDDSKGVAYLCNDNNNNNYDIHVADSSKIRGYIGSDQLASGNTLSQNAELQIRNDYTEDIRYYHYNIDPLQELTLYSDYVIPIPASIENTCPDHYGGGGTGINVVLSSAEKSTKEQAYDQNMIDYTLTLDLINTLKDGGDTPLMEHEIETAWPDEMWDLRATLLANSPHLSFEVLKDVADRTDVFPESVQFEIFSANPDEMNYDFLTYLETKAQPMPQYMVDLLRQVGYGSSYKTVLKNQLASYWSDAVQSAQDLIRSELFDSITDMSEVRLWLGNIGGYQADKQIIASYLQQGDYTSAQNLLAQLPSTYSLSGDDLLAYNDYNTLMQMQINLMQQGRSIFDFDSSELATVNMLATQGYGSAKKQAQSILEYAYGQHFYDCPYLPDSLTLKRYVPDIHGYNEDEAILVSVKPNPGHAWVAFDFTLPFNSNEGNILIIDVTGHVIETIQLGQNKGQKVLDTRHIPAGVYIYKVESSGYTKSGKLIIR